MRNVIILLMLMLAIACCGCPAPATISNTPEPLPPVTATGYGIITGVITDSTTFSLYNARATLWQGGRMAEVYPDYYGSQNPCLTQGPGIEYRFNVSYGTYTISGEKRDKDGKMHYSAITINVDRPVVDTLICLSDLYLPQPGFPDYDYRHSEDNWTEPPAYRPEYDRPASCNIIVFVEYRGGTFVPNATVYLYDDKGQLVSTRNPNPQRTPPGNATAPAGIAKFWNMPFGQYRIVAYANESYGIHPPGQGNLSFNANSGTVTAGVVISPRGFQA